MRCSNALAILQLSISREGQVTDASYKSGFPELEAPALAAVKTWSYAPYIVDGKATPVQTQASIFYLGNGTAFPMYTPDGHGGATGGHLLPLPSGCGTGPAIKVVEPASQTASVPATLGGLSAAADVSYRCGKDAPAVCPSVTRAGFPAYSNRARKARLQGIVYVALIVDRNGNPSDVHLARSIGEGLTGMDPRACEDLDKNALLVVKQYRFRPGTLDGHPVPVSMTIEVNFQLF